MQSSAQGIAVPLRLGAILSLLMLLCAPLPAARAGCSAHYVTSRTQTLAEAFDLDLLVLNKSTLPNRDEIPPSRPTPCSGALCSGTPAIPLPVVPPVMTHGHGDWAISLRPPVLTDPGSIARPVEDARLVRVNHPSSIFHPPRHRPRPTT